MSMVSAPWRLAERQEAPFLGLLLSLMTVLAAHPFLGDSIWERVVLDLLFSAVLLTGLWSAASHVRQFRAGLVLLVPAILAQWVIYATGSGPVLLARLVLTMLFLVFTAGVVLSAVLRERKVSVDTISGGICVYLLLALTWALLFSVTELLAPGSFQLGGQAIIEGGHTGRYSESSFGLFLYLSMITITTLGYGDVVPATASARMLTAIEAFTGQLFLAVFIARLVALHTALGLKKD